MIRIAITGPESSGKTTLCRSLSEHLNVSFVPEFARSYLEKTNGEYDYPDLNKIAMGQLERVKSSNSEVVISDSDFSVLEIWSQYKYGSVSAYIQELVKQDLFDYIFYVLLIFLGNKILLEKIRTIGINYLNYIKIH